MWWLAGLAALQASPNVAAPGTPAFDIQCMIVTQHASSSLTDQQLAMATQLSVMFFMGRVDQRFTDSQMIEEAMRVSEAIQGKPLGPMLQACGDYMAARGKRLERLGEEVERREAVRQAN